MSGLFRRSSEPLPVAVSGDGVWVTDADGRRYLDAAGGAIVVGVGHGDRMVVEAIAQQAATLAYVHPSTFTTDVVETYARRLVDVLPMARSEVFPVSGGAEAVETALKVARAYHRARGDGERSVIVGRELSYHGNTRGALDVSGRESLRAPYLPWLGLSGRAPGVLEYRCRNPEHPDRCADWHGRELEDEFVRIGPERVAAFIAEPIGGAASGAAEPPHGYWDVVSEVCRRHGVLIIADEVMTGFGRTGTWFACEHFGLQPDVVVSAKGASSGYWPLGICAWSGAVGEVLGSGGGLVHGFTFSHHPVGAAAGLAVLDRIEQLDLVQASVERGRQLIDGLRETIGGHRHVGDVRGRGLLVAIEFVADTDSRTPFDRSLKVAESFALTARASGLLVYPSSGCADGIRGDLAMFGPPLTISSEEVDLVIERTAAAIEAHPWP